MYVDPLGDPAGFIALLVDRSSALILGQWTPYPAAYVFLDGQNRAARRMEVASASVSDDAELGRRDLILVNPTDSVYLTTSIFTIRWADGRAAPRRVRVLSNGLTDVRVARVGESALLVEPVAGLFPDPFSRYHRSNGRPFRVGDLVELDDLRVEVLGLDPDGRGPSSIRYDFNEPLEAERYLWMTWNGNRYEEWTPPAVGDEVLLPSRPGIFE